MDDHLVFLGATVQDQAWFQHYIDATHLLIQAAHMADLHWFALLEADLRIPVVAEAYQID